MTMHQLETSETSTTNRTEANIGTRINNTFDQASWSVIGRLVSHGT